MPKECIHKNILLVRTDRIGDVILSLPAAALLKDAYPGCRVTFLGRDYTAPLIEMSESVDQTLTDPKNSSPLVLAGQLKPHNFDAAVLLHPTSRLAAALWLAEIPVRVGTAYRSYSFLFNRRVKQHRRAGQKHELEHNLDLVYSGLCIPSGKRKQYVPVIKVPQSLSKQVSRKLEGIIDLSTSFVAIHPGSGGSSQDWSLSNFAHLADRIQNKESGIKGLTIAVTLGPGEDHLKGELERHMRTKPVWVSGLSLPELAAFLDRAELLVSNSTGPLHIATAVGTRVIGLYCPSIACHPRRWGPYGPGHTVLMPSAKECGKCKGPGYSDYDCMEMISVDSVVESIQRHLET